MLYMDKEHSKWTFIFQVFASLNGATKAKILQKAIECPIEYASIKKSNKTYLLRLKFIILDLFFMIKTHVFREKCLEYSKNKLKSAKSEEIYFEFL